jgi:TonB family protein
MTMNRKKRGRLIGIMGTLAVHAALIALLMWIGFTLPERTEENGVEVMMGNVASAHGGFDPSSLVDVDVLREPEQPAEAAPAPPAVQDLLTQETEETVAVKPKAKPRKERPEKSEAEKAAEAKRIADEKAERERKANAEITAQRVAGAFGKGARMGDKGTGTGAGAEGSPAGNATTGATTGTSGYGDFDLNGRLIGEGGLPRPAYNVQEEGRVVVSITVNPAGEVIATGIDQRTTNTINPALRKAAEDAAKKARFNAVDGVNNQTGTITYYFRLK